MCIILTFQKLVRGHRRRGPHVSGEGKTAAPGERWNQRQRERQHGAGERVPDLPPAGRVHDLRGHGKREPPDGRQPAGQGSARPRRGLLHRAGPRGRQGAHARQGFRLLRARSQRVCCYATFFSPPSSRNSAPPPPSKVRIRG